MKKHELISAMWDSNLPPMAKLVFLAILDYRNAKTGECFPSMESISLKTGICRNTVAASIKSIESSGFFLIKKVRPAGAKFTINTYKFNVQCTPDEQSNEQSVEQSNERSPDGHKPLEPKEPKEGIDKSIPKKKRERKKISLNELGICHIADWLARKRSEGKYIHHNETDILEYFKTYCESKNKRYDDYAAALRLSFDWERNQPKGNTNGTRAGKPDSPLHGWRDAWQAVIEESNQRPQNQLGQLQVSGSLALTSPDDSEELGDPF